MGLIFDLGKHRGLDTKFYLDTGFHVIPPEAKPILCGQTCNGFSDQLEPGHLAIIKMALAERSGERIKFHVNNVKADWSSASTNWAEKGGHVLVEIEVETITLMDIIAWYGTPCCLKFDFEGSDAILFKKLRELGAIPNSSSLEASSETVLLDLKEAGYSRFHVFNQAFNGWVRPPNPPREGKFVEVRLKGHMSGVFGKALEDGDWVSDEEWQERSYHFATLRQKDLNPADGLLCFEAGQ